VCITRVTRTGDWAVDIIDSRPVQIDVHICCVHNVIFNLQLFLEWFTWSARSCLLPFLWRMTDCVLGLACNIVLVRSALNRSAPLTTYLVPVQPRSGPVYTVDPSQGLGVSAAE
jgi:hypothetical protein